MEDVIVRMSSFRCTKQILVSYLIIAAIVAYFNFGQANAGNGNEAKVTSHGGYTGLFSKAQDKGAVKIIVRVRAPFTPEPLMQEKGLQKQRSMNAQTQNQVIAELEGKGHKPGSIYKYKYTPYIAMTVDSAALDALLSSPDVISIEEDIPVPPTLDQSVPRIGATQLHAINITGSGVVVAVLDTGVDKTHPFLLGSVVSEACYSTNGAGSSSLCPGGVTESEADGSALPYPDGGSCPSLECDHGTHVAGIVAGRDGISGSPGPGVAPEAGIIAIQIFSLFTSEADCGAGQAPCVMSWTSDEIKGLERVYELRSTYSISSANMSLGGEKHTSHCDQESPGLTSAIDNLRAAGIATVVASGNDGYCGAISFPACISSAVSVGATTDSDTVASYSNSASFLSLLAPGSSIISSIPGNIYQSWSGTSMATPHVAGSWALMKQAFPGATVDTILSAITSTGLSVTDQSCTSVTKQRINVYEAYTLMGFAAEGTVGTIITFPAFNFGDKKGKVLIGGLAQKVDTWTSASVKIIFTKYKDLLTDTPYDISIQPKGAPPIVLPGAFTMRKPELDLASYGGTPEQPVTITGRWFGTKKGQVYVNQQKCKVTAWSMDPTSGISTLTFIVHRKLGTGTSGLEVVNKIGRGAALFTVN